MKTTVVCLAAFAVSTVEAATKIAVLEFGKGGTVRRTTSKRTTTSVGGATSFVNGVHGRSSKPQPAGMAVVPDLFNKADGGLVLGVSGSGVDLDAMPSVSKVVETEGGNVAGHMKIEGSHCHSFMDRVGGAEKVDSSNLLESAKTETTSKGLSALSISVDGSNVSQVDSQLQTLINSLEKRAADSDSTFVLHLVIEEEEGAARRRELSRRLDEAEVGK